MGASKSERAADLIVPINLFNWQPLQVFRLMLQLISVSGSTQFAYVSPEIRSTTLRSFCINRAVQAYGTAAGIRALRQFYECCLQFAGFL